MPVRLPIPRLLPILASLLGIAWLISPQPAHGQENLPPPEPVETPTRAAARMQEVVAKTRSLLAARDVDGLETLAARLRVSHEQLDGGTWLLSVFYDNAVEIPEEYEPGTKAVAFYEKWAAERPQSITPQVCLVNALADYAWNARGSGSADSVSEGRWRAFHERLDRAARVLERARALPGKCPGLYTAAQRVALGQGWDRLDYRRLVGEAIKAEPTFGRLYTNTCYWLLPRWYGAPGDFEQWLADEAGTYPPAERDLQYARFVWLADRMRIPSEMVFAPGRLDWARTKRGFMEWLRRQPDNLMIRFEFTNLALLADDRRTAAEQFRATGGKYYPAQWDEARFEAARRFAFADGPNPLRPHRKVVPANPVPRLPPDIVARIKLGLRLFGGFVGGLLAGIGLLVIAARRGATTAGVIALVACPTIAMPLGTIATLVPAAGLWLYLRRHPIALPPALSPPRGWTVLLWTLLLLAIYLGLQCGAGLLAGVALGIEFGRASADFYESAVYRDGSAFSFCTNAAWITLLALLAICRPRADERRVQLGLVPCRPLRLLTWTIAPLLVLLGLDFFTPWIDPRTRDAVRIMALSTAAPVPFFLAVAFAAPLVEELIFRGYAFGGWREKIGPWCAILATALLFTACHFQYGWTGLAFIFIFAILIAIVRWRTGSLYPCLAIHMLNNLAFGLSLYFRHKA